MMRLAVFASGTGSILDAMLVRGISVDLVVVDRGCQAEKVAADAGVVCARVERDSFGSDFDRPGYTSDVLETLAAHNIDIIALAGYGTILDAALFERFEGKVLNTHPALLPSFPGWHGVRDALAAGVKVSGCTVHVATATVDSGPILAQEAVSVHEDDDEHSLHERIKEVERRLYPETLSDFLDQLSMEGSN
jgi:phosphoribosylglycinamide formyltransferase-1